MVTLEAGTGTAVYVDGILASNAEYGHLVMDGAEAERLDAA